MCELLFENRGQLQEPAFPTLRNQKAAVALAIRQGEPFKGR